MAYKKILGIYRILNLINNKSYVGSAISYKQRISGHKTLLKKNKHFNKHLQASYNKYGIGNFKFELLEVVKNPQLLEKREKFNIKKLKSNNSKFGYNKRIDCITNLGMKSSEQKKINLSLSHIGIKRTKQANLKIAKSQHKKVYKISLKGKILKQYNSIKEAAIKNKIHHQGISACCRNKLNFTGGYYWCFVKNYKLFKPKNVFIKRSKKFLKYKYVNTETLEEYYKLSDLSKKLKIKYMTLYQMLTGEMINKTKFIRYEI
jgi:hypothetical protein